MYVFLVASGNSAQIPRYSLSQNQGIKKRPALQPGVMYSTAHYMSAVCSNPGQGFLQIQTPCINSPTRDNAGQPLGV